MTGKPNIGGRGNGRGGLGTALSEQRTVGRWSREHGFIGKAEPRTTPLSRGELVQAVQVIERALIDGSRNGKQAEGLLSAYRDTLKKLTTL